MARVFISHSSQDKEFVRKLVDDLKALGHHPWLDEWEIRVGDCIISKIEKGIEDAEYVVIILSENSVVSGWVEREWKTKYWQEIQTGHIMVLPVLIQDCEIPVLLKAKKYADFRKNYAIGLVELMGAISPIFTVKQGFPEQKTKSTLLQDENSKIANLVTQVQSNSIQLSQLIAETLALAKVKKVTSLESFCTHELIGWYDFDGPNNEVKHRSVQVYVSAAEINMQSWQWGGSSSNVWSFIKRDTENFKPVQLVFPHPIAEIESSVPSNPSEVLISMKMNLRDMFPKPDTPAMQINVYASGNTHKNILDSVRQKLTQQLIELLPRIENT